MKLVKLVKYQMKVFFRGTGFVMPFIAVAIFLYVMYSIKPLDVIIGFLITGIFLFLIMVWVGMSDGQQEEEVMEQILIFKMNSITAYYVGKLLFLVVIASLFTILCVLFPIVQNLINGGTMFKRQLIASDIICSLLILNGSAICGAFFGNLFHPRVMKERRFAHVILVFLCVVVIARPAIIEEIPLFQYFLWVVPSIMEPSVIFAGAEYFDVLQSIEIFLIFMVYAIFYGVLKSFICHKHRF